MSCGIVDALCQLIEYIYQQSYLIMLQCYRFSQAKWITVYLVRSTARSKTSGSIWEQILLTQKTRFPLTQN